MKRDNRSMRSYAQIMRQEADRNSTFLEILPTLTRGDLERLIAKRPTLWARYAHYLPTMPVSL